MGIGVGGSIRCIMRRSARRFNRRRLSDTGLRRGIRFTRRFNFDAVARRVARYGVPVAVRRFAAFTTREPAR